jgi:hypothetical protein
MGGEAGEGRAVHKHWRMGRAVLRPQATGYIITHKHRSLSRSIPGEPLAELDLFIVYPPFLSIVRKAREIAGYLFFECTRLGYD